MEYFGLNLEYLTKNGWIEVLDPNAVELRSRALGKRLPHVIHLYNHNLVGFLDNGIVLGAWAWQPQQPSFRHLPSIGRLKIHTERPGQEEEQRGP